jgi:hypothetical protein
MCATDDKGGPMLANMVVDLASGAISLAYQPRELMVAQLRAASAGVPYLAGLVDACAAGMRLALLPAGVPFPFLDGDEGRRFLFLLGDDYERAAGPRAFHQPTLRKLLAHGRHVGLVPGVPTPAFYARAARVAVAGAWAVLVETREDQRASWLRFLRRHARVEVKVCVDPALH